MEKLKDLYNSIVACLIVGVVGSSAIIGFIYILCSIVEKIASIIL